MEYRRSSLQMEESQPRIFSERGAHFADLARAQFGLDTPLMWGIDTLFLNRGFYCESKLARVCVFLVSDVLRYSVSNFPWDALSKYEEGLIGYLRHILTAVILCVFRSHFTFRFLDRASCQIDEQ